MGAEFRRRPTRGAAGVGRDENKRREKEKDGKETNSLQNQLIRVSNGFLRRNCIHTTTAFYLFSQSFPLYSRSSFFLYFAEPRLNPFLAVTLFSFFVGFFFFHLLVLYIAYLPEWRNLKGKDIARFFFFVPLRGHS